MVIHEWLGNLLVYFINIFFNNKKNLHYYSYSRVPNKSAARNKSALRKILNNLIIVPSFFLSFFVFNKSACWKFWHSTNKRAGTLIRYSRVG